MGYPPPCQPPLVAAESSSPQFIPKNDLWIVDFLFPRNLLPGGRVSVRLPPKWLVYRVVSISTSLRKFSSLPVAGFQSTEVFWFFQLHRPFSTTSIDSVSTVGGPFPPARKRVARFPSVVSVSRLTFRRSSVWFGFTEAVGCSRGCPEELLLLFLPAMHSRWYYCN